MADQFNDSIPAVTNQITEDVADIAETLGFLKDCFEAVCTGWSNSDASGLKVDQLADAVTRTSVLQGGDVTAAIWRKIVNIGDWNMDSTQQVAVAHGIADFKKIRGVEIVIRNDADDVYYSSQVNVYNDYINATNIGLQRVVSGTFDAATFDSTSYNRGWIVISYVD